MRLAQWIRESKPDVIHTWMLYANLVGALAARVLVMYLWFGESTTAPWTGALTNVAPCSSTVRVAFLSRKLPARIVCCSEASLRLHKKLGYATELLEVIPNGFDLEQAKPNPTAALSLREELGVPADAILIGIAARFHPHKDHCKLRSSRRPATQTITGGPLPTLRLDVHLQNPQLAE